MHFAERKRLHKLSRDSGGTVTPCLHFETTDYTDYLVTQGDCHPVPPKQRQ